MMVRIGDDRRCANRERHRLSHIDQTLGLRNERPARRVDGALVRLQPYLYGVIEYSILALYLALLYKQVAVVALLLLILSGCGVLVRRARSYVVTPIAVVAIEYVFFAMGTAFLVGFNQGVYRTAQFVLVFFDIAATKFFDWADQERKEKFLRNFTILTLLVFAHLVLYHLGTGRSRLGSICSIQRQLFQSVLFCCFSTRTGY